MSFAFDWSLLGTPLLAGLFVTATHVLLGRRVLERGIIFIDLSIAQVAALGAVVAGVFGWAGESVAAHAAALGAALGAAGLLAWTERHWPQIQEALIGCLYVVAASTALLVLANHPHGAEQMQTLLSGQILWVHASHVWTTGAIYALVLAAWAAGLRRQTWAFYVLFAVTVMASVELVGVFLVFATLILPALAAHGLPERTGLPVGYAIGAAGYGFGLWLSVPLDLPAGPLIVCTLAALALAAAIVRRFVPAGPAPD
ncbi:MAG: metal ABC transporter permease [Gammaproteobacteria bacterium]